MTNRTGPGSRFLNRAIVLVLALACTAAPLTGCQGTRTPRGSAANPASVQTTVSANAGGQLSVEEFRIVFPAGAFSSNTLVTAKRVTDPPALVTKAMKAEGVASDDYQLVSAVYDISYGNAALARPATIVIPYANLKVPSGFTVADLKIAQYRDGQWGLLPTVVDPVAQELRAETERFSFVGVLAAFTVLGLLGWKGLNYVAALKRTLTDPQYLQPDKVNTSGFEVDTANRLLKLNKPLVVADRGSGVRPKEASAMLNEARPTGMCIDFANLFGSLLIKAGYPVRVVAGKASSDVAGGQIRGGHLWVETVIDGKPYYVDTVEANKGVKLVPLDEARTRFSLDPGETFWKELKDGKYVAHKIPKYDPQWFANLLAATPPSQPVALLVVESTGVAYNGGSAPTFTTTESWTIVLIQTYHWNDGKGARPGTLALKAANGKLYGPWQATGLPAQGGVANGFWQAKPNVVIPAGTYTVVDSDPTTWSQNSATGGRGMTWVYATPK